MKIAKHSLRPRLIVTILAMMAIAAAMACGSTAPSDSDSPSSPPSSATTVAPASAETAAPTAVPAGAGAAPVTSDRGIYGGIVPMHDYAFPNLIFHPHEFSNQFKNTSAIYNGLLEYNAETDDPYDIRGDLAESWELQPDGVTYVFHLYENGRLAKWHAGHRNGRRAQPG